MMMDCNGMPLNFSATTAPSSEKSPSGRGTPLSLRFWNWV